MIGGIDLEHLDVAKIYLFGEVQFLDLLLLAMVLDIVTGLAVAYKKENLWSRKALFGYIRKLMVLVAIILANIIDQVLHLNGVVSYGTVFFYIGVEGLSVAENLSIMGVLIPKAFAEKLKYIKSQGENLEDVYKDEFTTRGTNDNAEKDDR